MNLRICMILLVGVWTTADAAVTEEQRKYVQDKEDPAFLQFLRTGGKLGAYGVQSHGTYTYCDIYLDSPDFQIFENNLSLRFRKRDYGDGRIDYGMQLKSEMEEAGQIRVEVEEVELGLYRVLHKGRFVPLTQFLDVIFARLDAKGTPGSELEQAVAAVGQWLAFKQGAAIAPFQKLAFLRKQRGLSPEIKGLRPVLVGRSERQRLHIYVDGTPDALGAAADRKRRGGEVPDFFAQHPAAVWTMESSFDRARFFPLQKAKQPYVDVLEFEVENKFVDQAKGKAHLDAFEQVLLKSFALHTALASKYRQSVAALFR